MKKNQRIHALDSLRATMMLLGVLLHTSLTYSSIGHQAWPIHSPKDNHVFFDWLFQIIHTFRMPIFFIVSGYFAALLFYNRSPYEMIKNRFSRIFLPFMVFLFLLTPISKLIIHYSGLIFASNSLFEVSFFEILQSSTPFIFVPFGTIHLWFLYYLMLFSIVSCGLGVLLKKHPRITCQIMILYDYSFKHSFFKIIFYSILTFLILFCSNSGWISASTRFMPHFETFIFYFSFYLFGWMLFKAQNLKLIFNGGGIACSVFALILFTAAFIFGEHLSKTAWMLINSFLVWLFSFGIISLFVKYLNTANIYLRYLLDASYWVYLIHLPLTILLPGTIHHLNAPLFLKPIIVVFITFAVSLISYHLLVRKTNIGKFLNGRKHV